MQNQKKYILSIGQCMHDHNMLQKFANQFNINLEKVDSYEEAITILHTNQNQYSLIWINRILDKDQSNGIEIIKKLKQQDHIQIPIMLISNWEEAQKQAISAGAIPGFGKSELHLKETRERILNVINQK